MQFLIIAKDHTDPDALSRRMAARAAHLTLGDRMRAKGELLYAVAMLNENDDMCGSVMVVELPSRSEVDAWLAVEPYVTGKVWQRIEIMPCKTGPGFVGM